MIQIIFVLGATNVGKSTLMDAAKEFDNIGTVEVGRMMRAKYPPSHFQGSSNPAHTATEAWQMLVEGLSAAEYAGKEYVLVDGQPRDIKQALKCCQLWPQAWYCLLHAPHEVREQRALARDGDDPEKMELTRARLQSDYIGLYHVLTVLAAHGKVPKVIETDHEGYSAASFVSCISSHIFKAPERT